jgi:hypothetical protein
MAGTILWQGEIMPLLDDITGRVHGYILLQLLSDFCLFRAALCGKGGIHVYLVWPAMSEASRNFTNGVSYSAT